jgi:acid phosphatase (class A)
MACALLASMVSCAETATVSAPVNAPTSDAVAIHTTGFLQPADRPDALALISPPPTAGSKRMKADVESYRESLRWRDTPRWHLAASDANVQFPHAAETFSCAAGIRISQADTPQLYVLLQRVIVDAGKSTAPAKEKYDRPRPFVVFDEHTCVPKDESVLRDNGAFPSGHASLGWAWALTLAELLPARANALFARGYEFGQSRVICGVHWQTDVDAGRMIGSAVMAKLHANPEFVASMRAASEEVRRAPAATASQCAAEASALAPRAPGVAP